MSTPAEASNDQPFFLDIPSITFLSCSHSDPSSLDSSSGYKPIDIPFNYELFTTENVDVSLALEEFESALLGGVGEELGLMGCEERKMMRGENQVRRGLMKEPSVAGLSSEPVDEVIDAECTAKMLDSSKLLQATCSSISGHMTVWLPDSSSSSRQLSESSSSSTTEAVYDAIKNYISNSYSSNSIVGVTYIPVVEERGDASSDGSGTGNEAVISGSQSESSRASILQDDGGSSWEILPGIGLLGLIVSLIALVGLVRIIKKQRGSSKTKTSSSIMGIEPEISTELSSQPPTPKLTRNLSDNNDTDDDVLSVATEDYPAQHYTQDEYIKRMPTYGSGWGESRIGSGGFSLFGRVGTGFSSLFGGGGGGDEDKMVEVVGREEDDMPSEMGEEIVL